MCGDRLPVKGPRRSGHGRLRPMPPREAVPAQGLVLQRKSKLPEFGLTASTEYVDRAPNPQPLERRALGRRLLR